MAQANAIKIIAEVLEQSDDAKEAAKLYVAKQYMDMYGEIGSKSNTMIFNDKPGDVNALLAQASMVMNAANPKHISQVKPPVDVSSK